MYIKVIKAGKGGHSSTTYECSHFTVDQRNDAWVIEFPQISDPSIVSISMPKEASVVYHMDAAGDTVDSWKWDPKQERAEHRNHDRPKHTDE